MQFEAAKGKQVGAHEPDDYGHILTTVITVNLWQISSAQEENIINRGNYNNKFPFKCSPSMARNIEKLSGSTLS